MKLLHTKDIPGSHVILRTEGNEPSEDNLLLAAQLAVHFSKASEGSKVPVDYTRCRFVKKPSGAKPGFVIFTNQSIPECELSIPKARRGRRWSIPECELSIPKARRGRRWSIPECDLSIPKACRGRRWSIPECDLSIPKACRGRRWSIPECELSIPKACRGRRRSTPKYAK